MKTLCLNSGFKKAYIDCIFKNTDTPDTIVFKGLH